MKVSMIGTGYVGLVSGTCFAEIGHDVTCIDIDNEKIKMLNDGKSPIYEPGLTDLIIRNKESGRLQFSNNYKSVAQADAVFLGVGTPSADNGEANLTYLKEAAIAVAKEIKDDAVIVIKSTVPVGTGFKIKELVASNTKKRFHIVNNPEFLKEGSAVEDFMRPDRVVIGMADQFAANIMEELYAPLVRQGNPIFMMSNLSAEMTKYASNCFLATKISFINEIARLCDVTGADVEEVRKGMSSDKRIGPHFLYPGPGYGGSCFPKDVKALIFTAKEHGLKLGVVESAERANEEQKHYMFTKISKHFNNDLSGKKFTFWGVAFKANTDDVREAPAISMANDLVNAGATVTFFDPVADENFSRLMEMNPKTKGKVISSPNKYEALEGSSGLVIMTEWREFQAPDFHEIKNRLKVPVIFDSRNIFKASKVLDEKIAYYSVGKRHPVK